MTIHPHLNQTHMINIHKTDPGTVKSLLSLPVELMIVIFRQLSQRDVFNILVTCRRFYSMASLASLVNTLGAEHDTYLPLSVVGNLVKRIHDARHPLLISVGGNWSGQNLEPILREHAERMVHFSLSHPSACAAQLRMSRPVMSFFSSATHLSMLCLDLRGVPNLKILRRGDVPKLINLRDLTLVGCNQIDILEGCPKVTYLHWQPCTTGPDI